MLDAAVALKQFLSSHTEMAVLALSLSLNGYLFRLYVKVRDDHDQMLERWLPMAERLATMVATAAEKARRKLHVSRPPPSGEN